MPRDHGAVVDEDARGLAVGRAGADDRPDRVEISRIVEPARHAQRVRQVRGPDEQHVRPGQRGDRLGVGDGRGVLDLEHAEDHVIERADVRVAHLAEALPSAAERDAALALRRESHPAEGLPDVGGRLHPRHDQAAGAHVEDPRDPQPVAPLDADERGRSGRPERVQLSEDRGLGGHPVLCVDDDPIEPGTPARLRDDRRAGGQPGAEGGLAAEHTFTKGRHVPMMTIPAPVVVERPRPGYGPLTSPLVSTTSRS